MSNVIQEFKATFTSQDKHFGGISHPVWSGGEGPPIILMHELDGFVPEFMQLALRLSQHFTVHAPVFYGEVGESFDNAIALTRAYFCIRHEFEVFRLGKTSPIADWIRELAGDIHQQLYNCNGVGIVGMCMTGGIVLATISHPSVVVGVAAQPSLPLATVGFGRRKTDIGMNEEDIESAAQSEVPVLVLRYGTDPICPKQRITSIKEKIPTVTGPPSFLQDTASHATLTDRFRKADQPNIRDVSEQAIQETVLFLSERL